MEVIRFLKMVKKRSQRKLVSSLSQEGLHEMNHYNCSIFLLIMLSFGFLRKAWALDSLSALPSDETLSIQQLSPKSTFTARTKLYSLGNYVSFPASGVKIQQPAGYEKDNSFDGFSNLES
jgi:hypothetical protein